MNSRQFPRHDFPYHDFPYRDFPCADYSAGKVIAASKGRRKTQKAPAPNIGAAVFSLLKFLVLLVILLIKIAVKLLARLEVKRPPR
jgi:hypothetical protein